MDPPTIAPKFEWLTAPELDALSLVCSAGGTVKVINFEVTIPSGRVETLNVVVGMADDDDRRADEVEAGDGDDGFDGVEIGALGVEIGVGWLGRLLGGTQLLPKSVDTTTEVI